ncbi:hypothetical protein T05_8528 [Trichinella murrelli]|uniref:Uncharacterized protein n=1 Tax=Trichinella murrelli TaxID=144512 RepID=A0A0V0THY1_9BILA|nr:hypothetical protein T05_8528 [Trichinella murrelli]
MDVLHHSSPDRLTACLFRCLHCSRSTKFLSKRKHCFLLSKANGLFVRTDARVPPYPQWRQRRDYAGWKRSHPGRFVPPMTQCMCFRSAQGLNSSVQQWHQNCGEIPMNCFGTGADLTAHASAAFHALR